MATLAEVERVIASIPPSRGFLIVDERTRLVAQRPPAEGGGCVLVALGQGGGEGAARRPGDGREDARDLRADARRREAPSDPASAPVEPSCSPARVDGREGADESPEDPPAGRG